MGKIMCARPSWWFYTYQWIHFMDWESRKISSFFQKSFLNLLIRKFNSIKFMFEFYQLNLIALLFKQKEEEKKMMYRWFGFFSIWLNRFMNFSSIRQNQQLQKRMAFVRSQPKAIFQFSLCFWFDKKRKFQMKIMKLNRNDNELALNWQLFLSFSNNKMVIMFIEINYACQPLNAISFKPTQFIRF